MIKNIYSKIYNPILFIIFIINKHLRIYKNDLKKIIL